MLISFKIGRSRNFQENHRQKSMAIPIFWLQSMWLLFLGLSQVFSLESTGKNFNELKGNIARKLKIIKRDTIEKIFLIIKNRYEFVIKEKIEHTENQIIWIISRKLPLNSTF